ncbi:hypothetical protein AK812_SmicGene13371 [Symbiodinium microadriaticum]|uniref:Uncharacterized protein n=1 Tax=Symbiodinium microadriaticum TaxID=2951 RepID=A0A1Q9E8A5_SYMMI|nr:hypothetical protein AK812_SmicGene13371 [Symbiodinium microadriaticum]
MTFITVIIIIISRKIITTIIPGSLDDRVWRHLEWTAASELYPVLSEDLRGVRATVLAAVVPPELGFDIVACQSGGFIIRTKGRALPGSCFSRLKRPGGDSYQT